MSNAADALSPPRCHALFRCVGCGAMGAERDCVDRCDFRRLVVVEAPTYADLWAAREAAQERLDAWRAILTRLAQIPDGAALRAAYPEMRSQALAALRAIQDAATAADAGEDDERFTLWRCATCGQSEAPQECLGVCVRPVADYVELDDHLALAAAARRTLERVAIARAALRELALTRPREGRWEEAARRLRGNADRAYRAAPSAAAPVSN